MDEDKHNSQQLWKHIKKMFPERNTVDAEEIIFDGEVVSNSKQIVNKCNEYFVKSSDEIELCNKQNKQVQ